MTKWNGTRLRAHYSLALLLLVGNLASGQLLQNSSIVDGADWNGFDNTPSWARWVVAAKRAAAELAAAWPVKRLGAVRTAPAALGAEVGAVYWVDCLSQAIIVLTTSLAP